ncbi:WD40 repeat domain-containing protein [[Actinomadura] parvosata]|nr:WD40 repeat domain-containing protein [Nonomuraea sp. ATCC 55076]
MPSEGSAAWRLRPSWTSLLPKGVRSCPPLGSADGHTGWVASVVTTVLGGRPVALTGSGDHTVRVWDLATGDPVGGPLDLGAGSVEALAIGERQGRRVVVTGCYDATVHVWDLETRQEVMAPLEGHTGPVYAAATAVLDGRWVAVTGGGPEVRVWDLETGDPVGRPFTGHTGYVGALAVTELTPGHLVVVSGGYRAATRVSDLATGLPVLDLPGPANLEDVTTTVVDGRQVAVTCTSDDPTLQVWDLSTAERIGELFPQHLRTAHALATAVVDGRQVVVSTCDGGSVRASDLVVGEPASEPARGEPVGEPVRHDATIRAVATTTESGRPVAVTGGDDRTVRVWDLDTGDQVCPPLTGHTGAVTAVAATQADDRAMAITGGDDGTVHLWDLTLGKAAGAPLTAHHRPITAVAADMPLAITAGDDKTIRVWDLRTGEETGNPRKSDHRWVHDLATTMLDGRPVAVLGRWGGGFRVRDLATNRDTGLQSTGGNGKPVRLVAVTLVDGRPIAVTTDDDWRDPPLKVWDVATARQLGHLPAGTVNALAATTIGGHPVAIVAGHYDTVTAWSLLTFDRIGPDLVLPGPVHAVAATPRGDVVVCFDRDIAVFTAAPPS